MEVKRSQLLKRWKFGDRLGYYEKRLRNYAEIFHLLKNIG